MRRLLRHPLPVRGGRPMRTVSLRRRVVAWSLAVLAALLLVVGVFVDLGLGAQLRAEQQDRMLSIAGLAVQLQGTLPDDELVDQLTGSGVTAVLVPADGGEPVVGVPGAGGPGPGPGGPAGPGRGPLSTTADVVRDGTAITVTQDLADGSTLELRADQGQVAEALRSFRLLMALGSAAGLLLAGAALWWVTGRALRPLDVMTDTARAIAGGDRGRRLAPDRADTELGRAAGAFDAMLDGLEGAERSAEAARQGLQRFLSDASHELRTPLAGIGAGAELLLVGDLDPAERERVAADVVREARRAGRLVDDLLTVSRLEDLRLVEEDVDLRAAATAAAARLERLDGTRVEVVVEAAGPDRAGQDAAGRDGAGRDGAGRDGAGPEGGEAGPVLVRGDRMRLDQVLANLTDNARHAARSAAEGGGGEPRGDADGPAVRLRLADIDGRRVVVVSDSGGGVPVAYRERIFERLVRLDPARSRRGGGAGLGLAIARGIARAHGGDLACVDPGPGDLPGAAFALSLPPAGATGDGTRAGAPGATAPDSATGRGTGPGASAGGPPGRGLEAAARP